MTQIKIEELALYCTYGGHPHEQEESPWHHWAQCSFLADVPKLEYHKCESKVNFTYRVK